MSLPLAMGFVPAGSGDATYSTHFEASSVREICLNTTSAVRLEGSSSYP